MLNKMMVLVLQLIICNIYQSESFDGSKRKALYMDVKLKTTSSGSKFDRCSEVIGNIGHRSLLDPNYIGCRIIEDVVQVVILTDCKLNITFLDELYKLPNIKPYLTEKPVKKGEMDILTIRLIGFSKIIPERVRLLSDRKTMYEKLDVSTMPDVIYTTTRECNPVLQYTKCWTDVWVTLDSVKKLKIENETALASRATTAIGALGYWPVGATDISVRNFTLEPRYVFTCTLKDCAKTVEDKLFNRVKWGVILKNAECASAANVKVINDIFDAEAAKKNVKIIGKYVTKDGQMTIMNVLLEVNGTITADDLKNVVNNVWPTLPQTLKDCILALGQPELRLEKAGFCEVLNGAPPLTWTYAMVIAILMFLWNQ